MKNEGSGLSFSASVQSAPPPVPQGASAAGVSSPQVVLRSVGHVALSLALTLGFLHTFSAGLTGHQGDSWEISFFGSKPQQGGVLIQILHILDMGPARRVWDTYPSMGGGGGRRGGRRLSEVSVFF